MKYNKGSTMGKTLRKAFTMIELVFVIVILGILAALALPRLESDHEQDAADSILSAIRYTQHLALTDYKIDPQNTNWYKNLWTLELGKCSGGDVAFSITSDNGFTNASDPITSDKTLGTNFTLKCDKSSQPGISKNAFLSKKFGVTDISTVPNANNQTCSALVSASRVSISFDHMGRLYAGDLTSSPIYQRYSKEDCVFEIEMSNHNKFKIRINKETGYASIEGQIDS